MEETMLNNEKIRLMTKLALFESKTGKQEIRLSKYYKPDYVRYQVIKSIISATVGYALVLALIILYKSEYLIKNAVKLDYKTIGLYLLGFYIIVVAIYGLSSIVIYSRKYDLSRKKLGRYYKLLKRLEKMYGDESTDNR